MEALNILDNILLKSKGYEVALLTTYNFEIPFFERNVLNRLEANNIRRFGLFVDSKNYVDAINSIDSSSIGKKYIVTEVDINASFHPKIILLLGEKKARLIVTSANLTFTGYCYNNEIFNYFDYDENNTTYLSLIKEAYFYFVTLNNIYSRIEDDIFDKIKDYNYLHRTSVETNVKFVSNYNHSIIEQVLDLNLDVRQIDIAVPFYDNELNALKGIKEIFPAAKINLYVQNRFSTFNFKLNQEQKIVTDNINVFDTFKEIGTPAIYHGKVFRFITDDSSCVLYGSANCTEAALFRTSVDGGNYECDILAHGEINEFDYYFDNFVIIDSEEELVNRNLSYNSVKKYNFKHIPSEDNNKLHIKYKEQWDDLKIYINQTEYKYTCLDNELIIEINNEVPYGIFKIEFVSEGKNETINAFIIFKNVMTEYRNSNNRDLSVTLDKINNSKSCEYIKYYKMLLDLIPYDVNSLKEVKENTDVYNDAINQKESDDEFDEEFVVDFDIPDDILNRQKEYNKIESIKRGIISNFRIRILAGRKKGMHGRRLFDNDPPKEELDIKISIPLPEEEKFSRYIKRLFNSILDTKYLEDSSLKNYIDNIILLVNVVYTYNDDNKANAFNINDYNNLLISFFEIIQEKELLSLDEETLEIIKILLLAVLLQISQDKENQNKAIIEVKCRNILLNYDRQLALKNDYSSYLESSLDLINNLVPFEEAKTIIEKYFNYKNEDELYSLINEKINGKITIEKNNNILIVNANTSKIGRYMNTQNIVSVFSEVKNRYRQTKEVDTLLINIANDSIRDDQPNPIECVRYVYSINSSIVERYFKNKKDTDFILVGSERIT